MGDGSGQLTPAAWIQQASGQKGTTIKTRKVDSFQLLTSKRIADMGFEPASVEKILHAASVKAGRAQIPAPGQVRSTSFNSEQSSRPEFHELHSACRPPVGIRARRDHNRSRYGL
jgi:hypothetical protein